MKFKSLQLKLVTIFGLCLLIAIGAGAIYGILSTKNTGDFITKSSSKYANDTAKELLREKARAMGYYIEAELEVALDTARTLADMLSGIKDPNVNLDIDRDKINGILRSVLEKNDTFSGTYTLWEPNALDGLDDLYAGTEGYDQTGRFITQWHRDEEEVHNETPVDYENHEKYDNGIRKGEYYLLPRERNRECIIDPYPYSHHDGIIWIASLVAPIMVDDTFYGIAGVDMRLDFIQSLVERANEEFYAGAGKMRIVSHNGILAAVSNNPELVGKPFKQWILDDWQNDAELIRSGKEKIDFKGDSIEIIVPIKIGKTETPWAVSIEVPQDAVLAEVQNMAGELEKRGNQDMLGQVGVGLGIVLIVLVVIWLISRSIVRPLKVAVGVADQVSEGDLNVEFDIRSEDEVGQVLKAMRKMISYIQEVADVAEKISRQDLQVEVTPKSKQDVLNHSLQKMVSALQAAKEEIERSVAEIEQQNWLKDGINQLNNSLSGEASLQETCQKAVSFIARFVGAGHGVLYTYDPEHHILNLGAAFALTEQDQLSETYRLGEGIIGQVAQDRSPILLKNLKRADHLINTGTVSESPLNTYTFPLIYNDDLYGVLEVASFELLDEAKQNFLNEANQVIATVLFSALQRERVQELLQASQQAAKEAHHMADEAQKAKEEAQQQAEQAQKANAQLEEQQQQLRQQSEELQQINAHLEEQQQQIQQQREELQQQNENLKLAQEELERRSQELEAVNRNKSEFLANISHELRSPLNSIILVSNMLTKNTKGNFDDKDIEQVKTIHQAGEELLNLINEILELSKIESGEIELEPVQIPVLSEFEENVEEKEEKRGTKNEEQDILASPAPQSTSHILIVEDSETQREAIQDLLDEIGEVQTTGIASQKEAIEEIKKQIYTLAIIDLGLQDGSGYDICKYIKEHDISLPVIIYTGRDLTEEEERELLTYTDSIIIKTARSSERLLDEISILLHKIEPDKGESQPSSKLAVDLTGKKILIADDDVKNVFVLASALEDHGATVIDAKNGEIALDKLRQESDIDLVLMDVMMPGKDGYTTMREIRKDKQLKHLPIIALTAKALKDDRQKCIQAGANDYLSKPADYDTLIRLVNAWIEKK